MVNISQETPRAANKFISINLRISSYGYSDKHRLGIPAHNFHFER